MLLLLAFAFLAGIVTILSPCILPILPIILSGAVGEGKQKPLGIVAGFVASFTFFTLFLTTIVRLLNISADILRTLSIIVIFVFGLSLIVPQVQAMIEKMFSRISSRFAPGSKRPKTGFGGGLTIGLSLGLLWTPCVGPILASVISLALTGAVNSAAFFITLAYSLGTAIPMLIIVYTGRAVFSKIPWLLANTKRIQQIFGIVMIATAVALYANVDRKFQTWVLETFPQYGTGLTKFEENAAVKQQLDQLQSGELKPEDMGRPSFEMIDGESNNGPIAPEFQVSGEWFNSEPFTLAQQKGKVVLVDFWTYSCINCIRTLPYLRSWHEKYAEKGLVIVGVHSPEFEFEKSPKNLQEAINDFELKYPIFQDNEFLTWRAYRNRYWPAKYLVDKNGRIRYTHFGEGEYDETEKMIQRLLEETGQSVDMPVDNPEYEITSRTPELYLGWGRMEYLSSPQDVARDQVASYTHPSRLSNNTFSFSGEWQVEEERSHAMKGATLELNFESTEVFLVMRPREEGASGKVRVLLDEAVVDEFAGQDVNDGIVEITNDRLYRLIKLDQPGRHQLRLEFQDANVEVFAFTFG